MQHLGKLVVLALGLGVAAPAAGPAHGQAAAQDRTYRLAEVDGRPLPVTVEEEDGCREEVAAAALTLRADGEWLLEVDERETCGDAVEEETEEESGTYTTEGDTVRFLDDDADEDDDEEDEAEGDEDDEDELDLDDLDVGTIGGDGLTVRLEDDRATLVFRP